MFPRAVPAGILQTFEQSMTFDSQNIPLFLAGTFPSRERACLRIDYATYFRNTFPPSRRRAPFSWSPPFCQGNLDEMDRNRENILYKATPFLSICSRPIKITLTVSPYSRTRGSSIERSQVIQETRTQGIYGGDSVKNASIEGNAVLFYER